MPFHPDPFDFDYMSDREAARQYTARVLSEGRHRWRFSDVMWLLLLLAGGVLPWVVFVVIVVWAWFR